MKESRTRVALVAACLALLWLAEISSLRGPGRSSDLTALQRLFLQPLPVERTNGTGFAFDPRYGPFLEAVRERTPEHATIVLVVPATHELYVYQAAYTLAPRRLVSPPSAPAEAFIAAYGSGEERGALAIPGGTLARLP